MKIDLTLEGIDKVDKIVEEMRDCLGNFQKLRMDLSSAVGNLCIKINQPKDETTAD